ncbi:TonB-dependent receptor [Ginsengibacter hankyongi]|uniref:TonB-dependent receptor n=1 Tax=Ginsengibacter hankyongi TaxID=2607284 RepID=A0A5J5IMB7_9BACT|nr:TonB-dependent receptor [Ginsengibacter hankyongi]KAA9041891.1 TonB-dependent receptor [Ginsengibacter hankyongi]
MKLITTLIILVFSAQGLLAQNNTQVSGKIAGENNSPLSSATVVLLKAKDSSLIKSAVTNSSGIFKMISLKPGSYFISATSVGYEKNSSPIFTITDGQDFNSPTVTLTRISKALSGVTIQAKKPMIEVRADKTVFNVENSINATGSNAFELLQKSPGVTTDKDDNISMQGKNGVKIYIDGKPSQMSGADLAAYLRSVNSADIESIEMITNPSAKYDASGNAGIINIRLKKNKNYGANGNFATGVTFGHTPKYNNSLSLNYRNKKINIFSNYSNNYGHYRNIFNLYRVQNDSTYDQHSINLNNNKSNNVKAGIDYSINTKNIIGVMVTANFNNSTSNTNSNTVISPNSTGTPNRILYASNDLPGDRNNVDYNINYHFADTSGRTLDVDADLVNFRRRGSSYQPNYYRDPFTNALLDEKIYSNNTPTNIDIYTAKIDYEQPFYKGKLGFGGKLTDVKTKNTFDFYNVNGGIPVKDMGRSNKFNYDENVKALYVNYNRSLSKKTTIQAGVRMENTKSEGDLISNVSQPDNTVKRNYTDFFPSGAITYKLNEKNTFNLNYSRRIDRPGYQDLNPFEDKLDELTYRKGNAFLNPQYTNSFQLSHTFLYKYVTSISYSHIKDYFAQIIDTVQNKSFITQKNLAQQNIFSLNFSAPVTITKWWSSFATLNAYHSAYLANFGIGKKINVNVDALSIYTQQSFSIKKGPTFELSGFYNTPSVWGGTFKSSAIGSVDVGVQQKLFKGTGTIKVSFTDVLNTLHWKGISDYGGSHLEASGHFESQQLKINFSYRFGNNLVKAARQRKAAAEDENKRLNSSGGIGQ